LRAARRSGLGASRSGNAGCEGVLVANSLTQTGRPDAGEHPKPHEIRPAQPADDAANLAGSKMRRFIVHWSRTKPL